MPIGTNCAPTLPTYFLTGMVRSLLLTVPNRYFRCGFICFMFGAVQFLNVLISTLPCVLLFNLVKLTELPPV